MRRIFELRNRPAGSLENGRFVSPPKNARAVRLLFGAFFFLSVPAAFSPCCYLTSLLSLEPDRLVAPMEPTTGGRVAAFVIYVLLGVIPFLLALLRHKHSPMVHRLLSAMLWPIAFFSLCYAVLVVRGIVLSQDYGREWNQQAMALILSVSLAVDAVRFGLSIVLLVLLRRPDMRALYKLSSPPKRF